MRKRWRYESQILLLFMVLLLAYLVIAWFVHAPRGYYGTKEAPRFADPWISRTETIMNGGLLYRDVFTTTPPLTNFLLIPPSLIAKALGLVNPWATLSFMIYFSLFNLFGAFVLFFMANSRAEGWMAAFGFLFNPLTFGNTVLRRQDESILTFFFGIVLLLFLKRHHLKASLAIGFAMLIKLTGVILIPVAFLHSWNWRYAVIPFLVFFIVLAPFLILAGQDAVFWDVGQSGAEHPFQFKGVSLYALWNKYHDADIQVPLQLPSIILVVGVMGAAALVVWKRYGVLLDLTIILVTIFVLSPKVHTGYYSILVLTMTPLLRTIRQRGLFFLFGLIAIVADFYKWPIEGFQVAFWLMVLTNGLLVWSVVDLCLDRRNMGQPVG